MKIFHACSECDHVLSKGEDFCPKHPDATIESVVESVRSAASTLGKIGGSKKSEAKTAAVRENGRKGGSPGGRKIIYNVPTGINNFHNRTSIVLVVSGEIAMGTTHNQAVYVINRRQAQRIANHFCGVTDCHCLAGCVDQLDPNGTQFGIRVEWC